MIQKVGFLICGTQKGGTTALANYLRSHQGLFIPQQKELHFFDNEEECWIKPKYKKYHSFFKQAPQGAIWGEATPIYMYWDESPKRIWKYNPAMKIISILRNPITRAYSHWAMEYERGNENLSFDEALITEANRSQKALPEQHRVFSYIDRGFYSSQIRKLWHFFGKDSVLILRQEELLKDPKTNLDKICNLLEINCLSSVEPSLSHERKYVEAMSPNAKKYLRRVFWNEICQLESLLNWNCSNWLEA